jgi:hypothetical protein
LENIVKWHIEIASALSFSNDNKEDDNWLLLPTASFFSRSYLDELLSEYHRLAKSAVELIPENIEFFDEVIYLHKRIFAGRKKLVKLEGISLIQGSYLTWSLLMEWRSYSSSSLDLRIANKYEDVLFDFVGSWESWLDYIEPRTKRFNDLSNSLPLFLAHLEFTAHTVITALRYNNIEAAGWGVDMLNNWIEQFLFRGYDDKLDEYRWNSELVTHNMLLKSIHDHAWITALNGNDFNIQSAFNIAINNSTFDLRVITACYIILKPNLNGDEKIKKYIRALLSCAPIHPTGSIGRITKAVRTASDILGAYIRHRDYPNYGAGSYGSWLAKTLSSFGRVNKQRMVSGRIYSGWGRDDPHSMNSAYVEIAVSLSNNEWQLERKWFDIIFSDSFRHQDQESLVRDLQEWLRVSDKINDPILTPKDEFEINRNNFKTSIQKIISQIYQRQNEIVLDAEIDDVLLTNFGLTCSKAIMGKNQNLEFPISLFKYVDFNGVLEKNNLCRINITDYRKEKIAKGISTNRAINENDWFKKLTKSDVMINVLKNILRYEVTEPIVYKDAENNVLDISRLEGGINKPVLFSGNLELNRLLHEARYKRELSDKLNISFIDGYGENYLCHIGEAIVYIMHFTDVNFSLLTTKDLFESIEFGKVTDGQFVKVEYKSSDDSENIGVLSINYWMDVSLVKGLPCIKTEILEL